MIRKIDPFTMANRALLPCDVYPFISGRTPQSFALARTRLKLGCLLHEKILVPGSLALQDPFVRGLALELLPFIKDGQMTLDLRSSCASFNELAATKYPDLIPHAVSHMADLLDKECQAVVAFDAGATSSQYSLGLADAARSLLARARSPIVIHALENAVEKLAAGHGTLTLEAAAMLMQGTHLHTRFSAMAKLLYSLEGARVTNTAPIVPLALWRSAFPGKCDSLIASLPDVGVSLDSDRLVANDVVMEYFSIDAAQIDKLSAVAILDLKHEPMTNRYIRELDGAVEEAVRLLRSDSPFDDAVQLARDRATHIGIAVQRRCEKERRQRSRESWLTGAVDEIGGATADLVGVGLARKGLAKLARRIAKNNKQLAWVDYTSAPLFAHVSRFQEAISG